MIEFKCSNCSAILRVAETHAGSNAKCPQCQAVSTVPSGYAETPPPNQPPPANPFADPNQARPGASPNSAEPNNPFSPSSVAAHGAAHGPRMGTGQPTSVEFGRIFEYGMNVWKENLGILVGATFVVGAISFFFNLESNVMVAGVGDDEIAILSVTAMISLINFAVQTFVGIGMTRIYLGLARGENVEFGMLFGGGDKFLTVFVVVLIATIVGGIGLLLLIIPGILLALFFWPYYYFAVDLEGIAIGESFSRGQEIAKLNIGTTIVCAIVSFCLGMLGFIACFVGILFAGPLIGMMWASAYLMMKGEIA